MIEHHSLSCPLNTSAVVMEMNRSKVFSPTNIIYCVYFCWNIIRCCVRKLRFILFMLLLDWGRMGRCLCDAGVLGVMHALRHVGIALINLDLSPTHAVLDNMLSGGLPILNWGNLSRILRASLSHSLDCCDYFLIALAVRWVFVSSLSFWLINFQFQNSVIWASSCIWNSTNWSVSFVIKWGFSGSLMRHFGLSALWGVHTTVDRSMWGILIADL